MDTTADTHDRTKADKQKSSAEAMAESAKASVQDGLDQAHETLDRVSSQAQRELRKVTDQTTEFVRENPGVAIAGAVGVGILVGLALRQRY